VADVAIPLVHGPNLQGWNVPGRKTDVNDATWLADLLAHGLIRGSFVPGCRDPGFAQPAVHAATSSATQEK
jgi:hypothetical protein